MKHISEQRLIPELRFSMFNKNWNYSSFGEQLLSFRLGGNYINSEEISDKPLIKMGNLGRGNIILDKVQYIPNNEKVVEEDRVRLGDLFFNTRNTLELVGKVAIWKNELPVAYYNSNLMRLEFNNNFFMNYRLNSFEGIKGLRRLATGTTSVAAIYTRDLLKMKLAIPGEPEEQQKIAAFLSAVDKKIQLLTRKKELLELYKKGVMQKIFSCEIRFKDDNGKNYPDWEEKRLGAVVEGYNKTTKVNDEFVVLTSSNKGLFKQSEYFGKNRITERDNIGFNILPDGYITYRSRSDNRKFSFNLNNLGYTGIISSYYPVFKINEGSTAFFIELTKIFQNYIGRYSVGTSQTVLSLNELKKIKLDIPCKEEQVKIGRYASLVDRKIEELDKQIGQVKLFKKGLLQQMFV